MNLPIEFVERMKSGLGENFEKFLSSYDRPAEKGLRVNTLKISAEEFKKISPFSLEQVPWEENGFYFEEADRPGKHPYHEAGVYYIQDGQAPWFPPCFWTLSQASGFLTCVRRPEEKAPRLQQP